MNFVLFNVFISVLSIMIRHFTPNTKDVFEIMKEIDDLLNQFSDETKEKMQNYLNLMIENKIYAYLTIFFIGVIPILNLILLYAAIKEYLGGSKIE